MMYLYAVAENLADIADLAGVQGEALIIVPFAGGVAVTGEVDAPPALGPETLHAQDALVRALHERASALLPMRFGTASRDREEAIRALTAHGDLGARLVSVRGCEQMVVRVLGTAPASDELIAPAASGTEYLRARASRHRAAPALDIFATGLGPFARAVKVEPSHQPGLLGAVYHLIARGGADEYRRRVAEIADQEPGVRVLVSGPSPAYAFA